MVQIISLLRHKFLTRVPLATLFLLLLTLGCFEFSNLLFWRLNDGISAFKLDRGRTALDNLLLPANLGDKTAAWIVGCVYAKGLGEVDIDLLAAKYWFKRAGFGKGEAFSSEQIREIVISRCEHHEN